VAGIDSSTQATKVAVRDAATGALVGEARAPHPDGTEVDPAHWWHALQLATRGGLLDEAGQVVRPALLWNDTRSAQAATDLPGGWPGRPAWRP